MPGTSSASARAPGEAWQGAWDVQAAGRAAAFAPTVGEVVSVVAKILVLGRQGAGKGTQAARLAARFGVPHLSTGDCFRRAVASGSELGRTVKAYMERGDLVPDRLVCDVVAACLGEPRARRGFVLDGFPRTAAQARALFTMVEPDGLDVAVDLDVPVAEVMERMLRRRVCRSCGGPAVAPKPGVAEVDCDCGGTAVCRDDDTPEAIRRRLALYEHETVPVLDLCRSRGILVHVDGLGSTDEVTARVVDAVEPRLQGAPDRPVAAAR